MHRRPTIVVWMFCTMCRIIAAWWEVEDKKSRDIGPRKADASESRG